MLIPIVASYHKIANDIPFLRENIEILEKVNHYIPCTSVM